MSFYGLYPVSSNPSADSIVLLLMERPCIGAVQRRGGGGEYFGISRNLKK